MASGDASPGKLKGRGNKARKTRIIKRETYSRRDFKGYKNGEEIYDTITKLIDEEGIEQGKREGIYCTVFKHIQANARKSMNFPIHEMTPDLGGAESLGTKELLAVLLSISLREVDKLVTNSTQELKVDVFVELSEGECALTRFPVRYYTTVEDLIGYVLKDRGVSDCVLDYQLSVVKTPFKGKSRIKSIMCAVGANNQHSLAGKQVRQLYPHQYPLHELGPSPKVVLSNQDGVPRVISCYFYVTPREAQPLTIYHRKPENAEVEEETLYLRPSSTTHEIIEQCMNSFDLDNDALAYKLILKAYEFDEKPIEREDQPLLLIDVIEDCQQGYPQIWIEDQELEEHTRTNSFIRKHSSRRASRKKQRPALETQAATEPLPLAEDEKDTPKSSSEISRIQNHLYHASLRRKTQSNKDGGAIKEQEAQLQKTMVEQDKVISALNSAVATAEQVSVSPQNSIKTKEPSIEFETRLKQALAEKQTQIWELEEHRIKDKETIMTLSKSQKSLDSKYKDLEDKFRKHKVSFKHDLEIEKREKRELEKEMRLIRQKTVDSDNMPAGEPDNDLQEKVAEMRLQVEKDQEIIDMTTQRNSELKNEIQHLKRRLADNENQDNNRLEVDGMQKSSMSESISINDFNEWSKDLDSLKKRNDQLLSRNKQLTSENNKLNQLADKSKSAIKEIEEQKAINEDLKMSVDELNAAVSAREVEIASLNERLTSVADDSYDDFQEKYYDLYEKNQHLESVMSGTIEKLRSKIGSLEDDKVEFQNTINSLNTSLDGKKRQLKEYDYMKNRVEMMEMEHVHLKEFSSQLIEENKAIDSLNKASFEKDETIAELEVKLKDTDAELIELRGLEKLNSGVQVDDPRIEDLSTQLEEALGKIDSRNIVVDGMNKKVTQKEEEISNMKSIVSDFEKTNEIMTSDIQKLQKQNKSLESKVGRKTEEVGNFKTMMDALNEQILANSSLCSEGNCQGAVRLKENHETKVKEMEDLLSDSKVNFEKYSGVTAELMSLRSKYEAMEDEMSIMEADKEDAVEDKESAEKSLKDKETKVTELFSLTSSLRDEVDTANSKITEITSKRDELAKELVNARQKSADIELNYNESQEEIRAVKRKIRQSNEQSDSLKCLNDAITAQLQELQSNDCSQGKCPRSLELVKDLQTKEDEKTKLSESLEDQLNQRKDLQNVIIKSKNELAERMIEYEEMEATYLEAKEKGDSYKAQLRALERKTNPKKRKDHIDNLENQLDMYKAEVTSLKSVTRGLGDEVERMSIVEQETDNQVQTLNERNASLDKQLGDAKGDIHDLEEQLQKFKESLRESQKESATVDMYLSEREMMKSTINELEDTNKALDSELKEKAKAIEELSLNDGSKSVSNHEVLRLKNQKDELQQDVEHLKESLESKQNECSRQVEIIDRHKARTRDTEKELNLLREQLKKQNLPLVNGIDIVTNIKSTRDEQPTLDDLNITIASLTDTVKVLSEENKELETSLYDITEEEHNRQIKISQLENKFQSEVDDIHAEYKKTICAQNDELKDWINRHKQLSEEILLLEQEKETLEKRKARVSVMSDQAEMREALHEATSELSLKSQMAENTLAQYQAASLQIDNMEEELLSCKKKYSVSEKSMEELRSRLQDNDVTLEEYKERIEDMRIADENKRTEIRLLNKMIKEYTSKNEESEHEYMVLKGKYKEKKHKIDDLYKEITQLKSTNTEYENVIVALESTNANDTVDNTAKTHKIKELHSLLHDAESEASQKSADLEVLRVDTAKLRCDNDELIEEVKSYQTEWRRLTSLLNNVNHTNHANMDSCKRLEDKLDDIEFKVTEANVHIDVCEGDMFSRTEALVRENAVLEQKLGEKTHSLTQSERCVQESHDNVELLQSAISELERKVSRLQSEIRAKDGKIDSVLESSTNNKSVVDLERKIRTLNTDLRDKEQLLLEAKSEKENDESAFKVSLDTIVRSYEDRLEKFSESDELKNEEIKKLQSELKSYEGSPR